MASTYTPAGIELIADGEQSNTWGQTSNTNFELLEEMITGIVSISLASTSYTLSTTDGATSNGRHAVVVFTGSPGGTCTVTVSPNDMQKVYFVKNDSDQTVTLTQGSGGDVSVAAGKTKVVYCDGAGSGAEVVDISNGFDATTLSDLGVTASAAELNIMDGVTSTTAELNILDGVTATAAELNILDGVTATAAELNILDGVTATASELNILDGVTATAAEINILDGVTASTTELNYVANVTSAIQTQLNNKQPLDADLTAIAALTPTSGNVITGNGTAWVSSPLPETTPSGAVISFAGSTAPSGWLLCGGQAVSRSTYSSLFSVVGTTYGAGDGSTTFNLPDLRDRFVLGNSTQGTTDAGRVGNYTTTLGSSGGADTHTLTTSEIPSHTHTVTFYSFQDGTNLSPEKLVSEDDVNLSSSVTTTTSATGGGSSHNNMPPFLALSYIIKT